MPTVTELMQRLGLVPHPAEGGYFNETYRSGEQIAEGALPRRYDGPRSISTAIYYLITPDSFSAIHRLASDEVFHFYLGDPVEMLQLFPDGDGLLMNLGSDIMAGQMPQAVVPHGVWQGARLVPGGAFALLGTTVAPGFEFADYEGGRRAALIEGYPQFVDLIRALTRG